MKKTLISILTVIVIVLPNLSRTFALNDLSEYYEVIDVVNDEYSTELYILNENEFLGSPIKEQYDTKYENYISISIFEFKNECIQIATEISEINISAYVNVRSTLASKTVSFYSNRNSMTLTYKYSGSTFDSSYKPTATVKKLNNTNYFSMSSYSGSFKNSNKTYSVVAKGKIYTPSGVVSNKSFTVNFNL